MFDQYKQDQTVGIQYAEANGERMAGLRVWDRPDCSIKPLMEMSERAAKAPDEAGRDRIREEMRAYAKANGGAGAERLFVGKASDEAGTGRGSGRGRGGTEVEIAGVAVTLKKK